MEFFVRLWLACIAALYALVDILLLQRKNSHYGPFPEEKSLILMDDGGAHEQPITLLDRIRSLTGIYEKGDTVWYLESGNWVVDVWTCPRCLSVWLAFLFSIPFLLWSRFALVKAFIFHFSLVGAVYIMMDFFQMEDTYVIEEIDDDLNYPG